MSDPLRRYLRNGRKNHSSASFSANFVLVTDGSIPVFVHIHTGAIVRRLNRHAMLTQKTENHRTVDHPRLSFRASLHIGS